MRSRYLETFFRHRWAVCAPVVVALAGALLYVLASGHSYQSSASLWADNPLPGASSVDQTSSGSTPAGEEASTLSELLATRGFAQDVAAHSSLGAKHLSAVQLVAALAHEVTTATPGPQVLSVTVTAPTSRDATSTSQAVVRTFLSQLNDVRRARAQAQVSFYSSQITEVSQQLTTAEANLFGYVAKNPTTAGSADPTYTQLSAAVSSAQQQLQTLQTNNTQSVAALQQATSSAVSHVLDAPSPATPKSRRKQIIFAGIGGLLAGLVVSTFVLLILAGSDRTVRRKEDLEGELGLEVVGVIGHLEAPREAPLRETKPA